MKAKKLIDALGGQQATATLLTNRGRLRGLPEITRQRVWNWYNEDKIPAWAEYAYGAIWRKNG